MPYKYGQWDLGKKPLTQPLPGHSFEYILTVPSFHFFLPLIAADIFAFCWLVMATPLFGGTKPLRPFIHPSPGHFLALIHFVPLVHHSYSAIRWLCSDFRCSDHLRPFQYVLLTFVIVCRERSDFSIFCFSDKLA